MGIDMQRIIFLMVVVMLFVFAGVDTSNSQTIIRVNCGGEAYRDHLGNEWSRDQVYRPGSWGHESGGYALFYPFEINGTVDDPLYQAERNALNFYRFTVPNGTYIVTLKFAELYYRKIGERIFHVDIEGNRVITDFDMVATAGFATAIDRTFPVQVNDGILDIHFITIEVAPGITIAHANIKAIAVLEQGTHDPLLWVNKTTLNFGRNSFIQVFEVRNGGELPLEWTLYENPEEMWITKVAPVESTLHQGQSIEVRVEVGRNGLAEGFYQGTLTLNSNGGSRNVTVSMEVRNDTPLLEVPRNRLEFGALLTERKFLIRNRGTARLTWNAYNTNRVPWIKSISPGDGGMNPGSYQEVSVLIDRFETNDSTMMAPISINTNAGNRTMEITADRGRTSLRINCGGADYVDQANNLWFEDMHYQSGTENHHQVGIVGTEDDPLYQHTRRGACSYAIPIQQTGLYRLALHFIDTEFNQAQSRLFNIFIEDSCHYPNVDIVGEAQGQTPLVKQSYITIDDTTLNIDLESALNEPRIAGIELQRIPNDPYLMVTNPILNFGTTETRLCAMIHNSGATDLHWRIEKPADSPWIRRVTPDSGTTVYGNQDSVWVVVNRRRMPNGLYQDTLLVHSNGGWSEVIALMQVGTSEEIALRVNAGGKMYVDTDGNEWKADQPYTVGDWGYIGGGTYIYERAVGGTDDDPLYQSERWGLDGYYFDVPNGRYEVVLHFAEIYFQQANRRVMDVLIEGDLTLDNFDIFAEVGFMKPCIKRYMVQVNDNQLDIEFGREIDDPKISAIELYSQFTVHPIPLERGLMSPAADHESHALKPASLALDQNYPNPFNMETLISFSLPYAAVVRLEIFNMLGQRISMLTNSPLEAGIYRYSWDGTDDLGSPVPSGLYLYTIQVIPEDTESHAPLHMVNKMLIIK